MELDAEHGLVRGVVQVRRALRDLPGLRIRNRRELRGGARRRDVHVHVALRFRDGLLAPVARHDVVGRRAGGRQVQRHGRELQRGPALQEQHLVVVGHAEQRAKVLLGLRGEFDERGAAMADFHHGHAAALPVEQLRLGAL